MTSTWPITISSGSSIPFADCNADTVVPKRWAIAARVSPSCTTYVSCGGGGGAVGAAVGAGVATATGDGVGDGLGLGLGDGEAVAVGVARAVGVAVGDGRSESDGWAPDSRAGSIIPPATTTPPIPSATPAAPIASNRPAGARRARPAIPRQAGSGARTMRVDARPLTMPERAGCRPPLRTAWAR